jgi:hypothetical protein
MHIIPFIGGYGQALVPGGWTMLFWAVEGSEASA